jgi:site-specific recombinase XerC
MRTAPDSPPTCAPDSFRVSGLALDSGGPIPLGLGAAADLFCAARAAEGASPRTVEWYRMIIGRCVRHFGQARPLDAIAAAELRAWLLELRSTLSPESAAGYVRGLKAFGNWCVTEEIAQAVGFRALRRPKVPRRLIAPFSDPELRSLLALADDRERALALVFLDTGLRLSELASLRVGDVRPDGTLADEHDAHTTGPIMPCPICFGIADLVETTRSDDTSERLAA